MKGGIRLTDTNLFKPISIGGKQLQHRVVHAPTSRSRSVEGFYPSDLMFDYYKTRSDAAPGSLFVFESTLVGRRGGLTPFKSGVWTDEQCASLKRITDAIHKGDNLVAVQVFSPGRTANLDLMAKHQMKLTAPSKVYMNEQHEARCTEMGIELNEYTQDEIIELQQDFLQGIKNALFKAKFDFVELHCTSGLLIEQFLSPVTNHRTDKYGGTVANRARFFLELIDLIIADAEIDIGKIAIRASPWSIHNHMALDQDYVYEDHPNLHLWKYVIQELEDRKSQGHQLAYISVIEPRVTGSAAAELDEVSKTYTNEELISIWSGSLIRAGGYATNYKQDLEALAKSNNIVVDKETNMVLHYSNLINDVNKDDRTLIAFSRPFTSNPDFVNRLKMGWKLDNYNRKFFYTHGLKGYLNFAAYTHDAISNELDLGEELNRLGKRLQ